MMDVPVVVYEVVSLSSPWKSDGRRETESPSLVVCYFIPTVPRRRLSESRPSKVTVKRSSPLTSLEAFSKSDMGYSVVVSEVSQIFPSQSHTLNLSENFTLGKEEVVINFCSPFPKSETVLLRDW